MTTDYAKRAEALREAEHAAIEAMKVVLYARLNMLPEGSEAAHIRSRWMNPRRVVQRALEVTLLDRLELTGW